MTYSLPKAVNIKQNKIAVVNWVFCQSSRLRTVWKYTNILVLMILKVRKDFMELNRSKAIFRSTLSVIFCILLWLVWLNNAHFGYGLKDLLPLPRWCSCLWMWELMTSWVGQGIWISIMCDSRHFRVRAQNTCNGWLRDNVWPEMVTLKLTSQKLHSLVILTVTHALSWLKNSQILTCNNILDSAKLSPVNHRLYLFV